MSKQDETLWEIPRRPDTEWLFESDLDGEREEIVGKTNRSKEYLMNEEKPLA